MSLIKRIPKGLGLAALVLVAGCDTLNISNPNAPDSKRALSDPATVQSIAIGAIRTWYLTSQGGFGEDQYPTLTLSVMARSAVAAWNNYHIRFYTGCTNGNWDVYTTATNGTCSAESEGSIYPRTAWANDPASANRTQIEAMWYGYYAALSSANDVLKAIRVNKIVITDAATTKITETMAVLAQGLALSGIALNYNMGFVVNYNTDLSTLKFSSAKDIRDSALARFDEAIALANANSFKLPGDFFDFTIQAYGNVQVAQIANTMAARLLAYFPRRASENADVSAGGLVDWARVATYASKGISSGTPFDLVFHQDACNTWCDFLKVWSNDMTTMRIHSRIAHELDPVTQPDPWNATLDANPNSPDKRLGNGTYRGVTTKGDTLGYEHTILSAYPDTTGQGGYDYVWSYNKEIQNKARGAWHQDAVGHIRYDTLTACGDNPQGSLSAGVGDAPMVLAAENDLIWAEALLRQPSPNAGQAAILINYTHVGPDRMGRPRGGLAPATGTLAEVQYEQDVELANTNVAPFYNQRRIDRIEPLTPREMPVPAKELGVLQVGLYTCGGSAHPDGSCGAPGSGVVAALMTNAPRIWAAIEQEQWQSFHRYGLKGRALQ